MSKRTFKLWTLGLIVSLAGIYGLSGRSVSAFSAGPLPSRTGAPALGTFPAEANCTQCHRTNPEPNSGPGMLAIGGLPQGYSPNQEITVTVTLTQAGRSRYGFQLTALDDSGNSVGTLTSTDARTRTLAGAAGTFAARSYIEHTLEGTNQGSWSFIWRAPAAAAGRVTFYVAGNAADGSGTNTGDFIYTNSASIQPGSIGEPAIDAVGVFREGFFWLLDVDGNRQFASPPDRAFALGGIPGDIPIAGDWSGDGHAKAGIYRPSGGLFILDYDGDGQYTAADKVYYLGVGNEAGDAPVVGDWNGDGRDKVGLFRQGFFWILDTNGDGVFEQGADQTFAFGGVSGDLPVVGDWDGGGRSKLGLFRQGFYWILDYNGDGTIDGVDQAGGDQAFAFGGVPGDVPVVGDWNGDGRGKVGVFRQGFFWVLDANGNHQFDETNTGQDLAFPFGGIAGDKPVVGKW